MTDKDDAQHLVLPPELEQRVIALARAAGAEPAKVLERLVDYALGYGEGLAAGVGEPLEVVLVKLHDLAHAGDELAGHAAALLDGLDAGEFDANEVLAEELAEEIEDADELRGKQARALNRQQLVEYIKRHIVRDFFNDPSA